MERNRIKALVWEWGPNLVGIEWPEGEAAHWFLEAKRRGLAVEDLVKYYSESLDPHYRKVAGELGRMMEEQGREEMG